MRVIIKSRRDKETKRKVLDVYFNKKFQVSCLNKKEVKSYISVCKFCGYKFINA